MTRGITEKQRVAMAAMEAAGQRGVSLSEYARTHGLVARDLYSALTALRRKGVLGPAAGDARSEFVAVRVAQPVAGTTPSAQRWDGSDVVCRIVGMGFAIECLRWPEPRWIAALSTGSADAAA